MALKTGNPYLDAIGGSASTDRVITIYFDNATSAGPVEETSKGNFDNSHSTGGAWTAAEKSAFWDAMHTWTDVADIRFLEVDNLAAADVVERKQTSVELGSDTYGRHSNPGETTHIGQFNTQTFWTPDSLARGGFAFETFVHELGHGIGLAHPHDTAQGTGVFPGVRPPTTDATGKEVTFPRDLGTHSLNQAIYTVMSYNDPAEPSAANAGSGWIGTPMAFDIAAVQLQYGAVARNSGDTVYTLPDSNGPGTFYSSIWDTGGVDTIQYNGSKNATIDLRAATLETRPGGGGYMSQAQGVNGGFTIAADVTDFDKDGNYGVVIENAIGGSGNDTINGNSVRNILRGEGGNDTINGYGGADTMIGGAGNDTYFVDNAKDETLETASTFVWREGVLEFIDSGIDTVETTLKTYKLQTNVENLTLAYQTLGKGLSSIVATGTGNELENVMIGRNGHDTLVGLGGADTLDGRGNTDTMIGGDGNDTYYVESAGDIVDEEVFVGRKGPLGLTQLPYQDAGGTDTVVTSLAIYDLSKSSTHNSLGAGGGGGTLFGSVENLEYNGKELFLGTGNDLDNVIKGGKFGDESHGDWLLGGKGNDKLYGFEGGDRLEGGQGRDYMDGGLGSDLFVADNGDADGGDVMIGGPGYDQVWADASIAATGLRLNLFAGGTEITPEVDRVANTSAGIGIDYVLGTGSADTINASRLGLYEGVKVDGLAGDDTLYGGLGADTFDGGADTDTFISAGKHDDYRFASLDDTSFSLTNLLSGIVDTLSNVELFKFADGAFTAAELMMPVPMRGTEEADTLIGDGFGNVLEGLGGDDTLAGLAGADKLNGGAGVDTADYSASAAGIVVDLKAGTASGGDAEGDTLIDIENLTGSAFADTITGGASRGKFLAGDGNDTLVGGSWFDWMEGGEGSDTITGTGGQTVQFGDGGNDIMTGSLDNANYFAGGLGDDVMTGGNVTDYISDVDGGDDIMYGNGGDDTLVDYYGRNTMYGGAGNDFVSSVGDGSYLDGGEGNDYLSVANGDYTVIGGTGNDTLEAAGHGNVSFTGGSDADIFTYRIFGNGPLTYTVTDFEDGTDKILLWDHKYYGADNPNLGFDDITITDSDAGAVISWHGTSEMTLMGVSADQITEADFLMT